MGNPFYALKAMQTQAQVNDALTQAQLKIAAARAQQMVAPYQGAIQAANTRAAVAAAAQAAQQAAQQQSQNTAALNAGLPVPSPEQLPSAVSAAMANIVPADQDDPNAQDEADGMAAGEFSHHPKVRMFGHEYPSLLNMFGGVRRGKKFG